MLNFFRRRASMVKIVFGVVLFLTCISMVITLIPGITGDTTDTGAVALALELDCDAVCKVTKVDGVYDKDPVKHNGATRLPKVTFQQAVEDPNLRIMDKAALGMAMENKQKIVVCDLASQDNIRRLVLGEDVGTVIS